MRNVKIEFILRYNKYFILFKFIHTKTLTVYFEKKDVDLAIIMIKERKLDLNSRDNFKTIDSAFASNHYYFTFMTGTKNNYFQTLKYAIISKYLNYTSNFFRSIKSLHL